MMRLRLSSGFQRVAAWARRALRPTARSLEGQALNGIGEAMRELVYAEMKKGPPPKLRPRTVAAKKAWGASDPHKTWKWTGWMQENGLAPVEVKKRKIIVRAADGYHPEWGVPVNDIFLAMEFGNSRQAPRPVLQPVIDRIQRGEGKVEAEIAAAMEKAVKKNQPRGG